MSVQLLPSVRCTKCADAAENARATLHLGDRCCCEGFLFFISTEAIWMLVTVFSRLACSGGENVRGRVRRSCSSSSEGKRKPCLPSTGASDHTIELQHIFLQDSSCCDRQKLHWLHPGDRWLACWRILVGRKDRTTNFVNELWSKVNN